MANKKLSTYITELSEYGDAVASDDTLFIYDESAGALKKVSVSHLVGGWKDLRTALVGAKAPGTNAPSLDAFGTSGGLYQYNFGVGDEVFFAFHIDHDIKVGSTVYPHVHWATDGTSTNTVKWELEYSIAARNDDTPAAFPAPSTINLEAAASSTAWAHQVTEDATGFTAPVVDSLILCHLKRVTNGGTENTDEVFGLFVDIHYEAQQYGTPSRSPDFY